MNLQVEPNKTPSNLLPLSAIKEEWLKEKIRDIPDFPKQGIIFKDLTTLLKDSEAFTFVIDAFAEKYMPLRPDYIAGIEARGFIIGSAVAYKLGIGFVPIRKVGKLPHKVEKVFYDLEYGTDCLEVHADAIEKGRRVVLIDDLLATGGTAGAGHQLLTIIGGDVIGLGFVVELGFLNGRSKLPDRVDVFSMISFA